MIYFSEIGKWKDHEIGFDYGEHVDYGVLPWYKHVPKRKKKEEEAVFRSPYWPLTGDKWDA